MMKRYLITPPVLVPSTPGRPLLLYGSVASMGCILGQHDATAFEENPPGLAHNSKGKDLCLSVCSCLA